MRTITSVVGSRLSIFSVLAGVMAIASAVHAGDSSETELLKDVKQNCTVANAESAEKCLDSKAIPSEICSNGELWKRVLDRHQIVIDRTKFADANSCKQNERNISRLAARRKLLDGWERDIKNIPAAKDALQKAKAYEVSYRKSNFDSGTGIAIGPNGERLGAVYKQKAYDITLELSGHRTTLKALKARLVKARLEGDPDDQERLSNMTGKLEEKIKGLEAQHEYNVGATRQMVDPIKAQATRNAEAVKNAEARVKELEKYSAELEKDGGETQRMLAEARNKEEKTCEPAKKAIACNSSQEERLRNAISFRTHHPVAIIKGLGCTEPNASDEDLTDGCKNAIGIYNLQVLGRSKGCINYYRSTLAEIVGNARTDAGKDIATDYHYLGACGTSNEAARADVAAKVSQAGR